MEGYLGTILPWAGNYSPRGWVYCRGQMLPIANYTALYAIIGTQYGGDGRTTFGVPNLQSRVMVGAGQGSSPLQAYTPGQTGGVEIFTLTSSQMPPHVHNNTVASPTTVSVAVAIPTVSNTAADTAKPTNTSLLGKNVATPIYSSANADGTLEPFNAIGSVTPVSIANASAGGGSPIDNRQPYLAVNFIMCVEGLFPSRN